MRTTGTLLISGCLLFMCSQATCQSFANGDLNGSVGFVSTPSSWSDIPDTDPISNANSTAEATVDILDATGPNAPGGVAANPYSGATLCSGLMASDGGAFFWHEGIQQNVSGFTPGNTYTVNFYQAVVKQQNCIDESGGWQMYLDATLAGSSAVSTSTLAYDDVNVQWDCRSISFTATATAHTIKFIPYDDDSNYLNSPSDNTGGLRMGIDMISFGTPVDPTILTTGPYCQNEPNVILVAATTGGTWSGTGITDPMNGIFSPALAGSGSHTITYTLPDGCSTVNDVAVIDVIKPPDAAMSVTSPIPCDTLCVQFTDLSVATTGTITDWLWDFGDGNTSTDEDPYHCYADTGLYDVSLVVDTDVGCSDTLSLAGLIQLSYCATSVKEWFGLDFHMYPNPSTGPVYFDMGQTYHGVTVEVLNGLGQVLSTVHYDAVQQFEAELGEAPGWYHVRITDETGRSVTYRVLRE